MSTLILLLERVRSPLGRMLIATDPAGRLRVLDWEDHEDTMRRLLARHYRGKQVEIIESTNRSTATEAMSAYFEGDISAPESLPVATGGTDFQRTVWHALRAIPPASTLSYGQLAERIGRPAAVRAVGMANGANPISVVVPCHRVIGSNASLIGYGGGLARKRWLLAHEAAHSSRHDTCGTLPLPGF